MKPSCELDLSDQTIDFILRRSSPAIMPNKSLQLIAAQAYVYGMQDALDAIEKRKETTS